MLDSPSIVKWNPIRGQTPSPSAPPVDSCVGTTDKALYLRQSLFQSRCRHIAVLRLAWGSYTLESLSLQLFHFFQILPLSSSQLTVLRLSGKLFG
ncbi:MAG: hypothetical protein ACJ709_04865 [Nitrososphaeraceae archaeon]